jgi:hypothetical protein
MWFDTYEELSKFPDIRYAFHINHRTTLLVTRVESLNRVGNMLWPSRQDQFLKLPMSQYDWLNVIMDIFLMRLISVADCCLLLSNEVLELGLKPRQCKLPNLEKAGAPKSVVMSLRTILDVQGDLRDERNLRVHEGDGYAFTADDAIFRSLAQMKYMCDTKYASGPDGERIYLEDLYRHARSELRKKFNSGCRQLLKALPKFYSELYAEFEPRFSAKYRSHEQNHPIYGKKPKG